MVIVVLEVEVVTAISFLPIPARIYIENDLGYMIGWGVVNIFIARCSCEASTQNIKDKTPFNDRS